MTTELQKERRKVDHCHKTGKVRGIIHSNCNTMLGMANDNKDRLELAIKYLQENG